MEYEDDFVSEELIEFEIDSRKFKYKPVTTGNELDWISEYMEEKTDPETGEKKRIPNLKTMTFCKMRNIIEVPYTKENIRKIIGIDKEYSQLSNDEKDQFWSRINSTIADKIIRKINELSSQELKKNLPSR